MGLPVNSRKGRSPCGSTYMSERAVRETERRAPQKLARNIALRRLRQQHLTGELGDALNLTGGDIGALFGLPGVKTVGWSGRVVYPRYSQSRWGLPSLPGVMRTLFLKMLPAP